MIIAWHVGGTVRLRAVTDIICTVGIRAVV